MITHVRSSMLFSINYSFQMDLYNIQTLYRRVEEMPFNSDTKYMAVKCTPKYGKVSYLSWHFVIPTLFEKCWGCCYCRSSSSLLCHHLNCWMEFRICWIGFHTHVGRAGAHFPSHPVIRGKCQKLSAWGFAMACSYMSLLVNRNL